MPLLGEKVKCYQCSKEESFMWHQTPNGVMCNDCLELEHSSKAVEEEDKKTPAPVDKPKAASSKKGNKTARSYKTRQNPNALPKQYSTKGKGRRNIFKKKEPVKLSSSAATYTTSASVLYKGTIWRSGDIVSVRDVEGGIYYARLGMFLTDMYCEKSASITWLLPTRDDSHPALKKEGFDPMMFVLGPHDDRPHKLDYFEFVMNCPSDYFASRTPFPHGGPHPSCAGFIWGRLGTDEVLQSK